MIIVKFSIRDIEFININYLSMSDIDIARALNKSSGAIKELRLKKRWLKSKNVQSRPIPDLLDDKKELVDEMYDNIISDILFNLKIHDGGDKIGLLEHVNKIENKYKKIHKIYFK